MNYKQFDKEGRIITPTDLQNKKLWCKDGAVMEVEEMT